MPSPPPAPDSDRLVQAMLARLAARRPGATICPSEVARALAADDRDWRALMPAIRDTARSLARDGRLRVTQRGYPLDPDAAWHGPIRLAGAADPTDREPKAQVTARPADPQR